MTWRKVAGPRARNGGGKAIRNHETRKPARPARMRRLYEEDDDSLEIPDLALGGAKE